MRVDANGEPARGMSTTTKVLLGLVGLVMGLVLLVVVVVAVWWSGGTSPDELRQHRDDDLGDLSGLVLDRESDGGNAQCMDHCSTFTTSYRLTGNEDEALATIRERLADAGYREVPGTSPDSCWKDDEIMVAISSGSTLVGDQPAVEVEYTYHDTIGCQGD